MNLFATAPAWLLIILIVLLVAAMVQDATRLRISNVLTALVLVAGIAAMILSGLTLYLWQNFAVFAVLLTVGSLLFARGILGGGDVKLFAAVALWADLTTAVRLVSSILIAGGLLALIFIVYRVSRGGKWVKRHGDGGGIPYGIAISAGTMLIIYLSAGTNWNFR